jgi:hypothetical protein
MNMQTLNTQLARGLRAPWLCNNLTHRDMGLLDFANLAACAAKRAYLAAGSPDGRFSREYDSVKAWTRLANEAIL